MSMIHPSQVATVSSAFAPTAEEIAWATNIVKAADGAAGVFSFEGHMVDAPIITRALNILSHSGRKTT
jgi:citrate lyase beta subunit